MTSKPLTFQFQHLLWQQRIDKERGTELRVKDENDMFRTWTDQLPKYLKEMDRKKQRQFRGAHPQRYQADAVSLATTVTGRSKSIAGNSQSSRIRELIERRSQAGESQRSHLSTSQRLQAMSTRASGKLIEAHKRSATGTRKAALKDYIQENQVYEDVVDQINKKLALREAIERAHDAITRSKAPSESVRGQEDDQDGAASVITKSQAPSMMIRDQGFDAQSKASAHSKLSLITLSQKVAAQGKADGESRVSRRTNSFAPQSKAELRSTAHDLVSTLQMQLERERQQKRKLMEHLEKLENTTSQFKP